MESYVIEEKVLQKVMGNVPFGLVVTREGHNRKIYYMNSMAYHMLGYTKEEFSEKVQQGWNTFVDIDLRTIIGENRERMKQGEPIEILAPAKAKNGELRWLLFETVLRMEERPISYVSYIDITERMEIKHRQEKEYEYLKECAARDSLTKLLNRGTMEKLIEEKISNMEESKMEEGAGEHVYISIDVDDFKRINDSYGHSAGDRVILLVADLLSEYFKEYDYVGRMGGDEFAVFSADVKNREMVRKHAEKFRIELHNRKDEMGLEEAPSVSIGIAFGTACDTDFMRLYNCADEALYRVKNSTKNGIAVFE